jgi:hypothetical protein
MMVVTFVLGLDVQKKCGPSTGSVNGASIWTSTIGPISVLQMVVRSCQASRTPVVFCGINEKFTICMVVRFP